MVKTIPDAVRAAAEFVLLPLLLFTVWLNRARIRKADETENRLKQGVPHSRSPLSWPVRELAGSLAVVRMSGIWEWAPYIAVIPSPERTYHALTRHLDGNERKSNALI
jgi:hypothetical protein